MERELRKLDQHIKISKNSNKRKSIYHIYEQDINNHYMRNKIITGITLITSTIEYQKYGSRILRLSYIRKIELRFTSAIIK